jgi:hypothetical protein
MRLHDGRYECALCGAVLEIPMHEHPRAVLTASSGKRNIRVISTSGKEIHRCALSVSLARSTGIRGES